MITAITVMARARARIRGVEGTGRKRPPSRYRRGMALKLPRRVARFNKVITNPLQSRYAWLLPPWAIICHRGRRTGRLYRTPVNAYRWRRVLMVVVLYGEESDWVQNVLSGRAQVVRMARTYSLSNARLVDPRRQPLPARRA